jgi:hypothetical protein
VAPRDRGARRPRCRPSDRGARRSALAGVIAGIILFVILLALDLQNLGSRWGRYLKVGEAVDEDFTFVVPLFGSPRYFRNGDYLRRYISQTLLAVNIDSDEMRGFADQAEAEGWRVHRAYIDGRVSCPTLVRAALESVDTTYVIRIDGDTITEEHPGLAVAAVRRGQADLASVRVHVAKPRRLVERLQAIFGAAYYMVLWRRTGRWAPPGRYRIGFRRQPLPGPAAR